MKMGKVKILSHRESLLHKTTHEGEGNELMIAWKQILQRMLTLINLREYDEVQGVS